MFIWKLVGERETFSYTSSPLLFPQPQLLIGTWLFPALGHLHKLFPSFTGKQLPPIWLVKSHASFRSELKYLFYLKKKKAFFVLTVKFSHPHIYTYKILMDLSACLFHDTAACLAFLTQACKPSTPNPTPLFLPSLQDSKSTQNNYTSCQTVLMNNKKQSKMRTTQRSDSKV